MKYRPAVPHGTPNHLAQWVFHCGYNICPVQVLTRWPLNEHVVWSKLLHWSENETFFDSAIVQMWWISGKDQSLFLHQWCHMVLVCGISVQIFLWDVSKQCWKLAVPLKHKIALFSCTTSLANALLSHSAVFPGHNLLWTTRPFPVMKRATSIGFHNNIVHCWGMLFLCILLYVK